MGPDPVLSIEGQSFSAEYVKLWESFDGNSFFRSPPHLTMIAQLADCDLGFAVARDPVSGLPLACIPFAVKAGPFGGVLNSLPFFGTYGAVVGPAAGATAANLLELIKRNARERGIAAMTFIDDWTKKSFEAFDECNFVTERTNQFIDLTQWKSKDPQEHYHQKTRNLVRKARKEGILVEVSDDPHDVSLLEAMHRANMAAVGGLPKPSRFFRMLTETPFQLSNRRLYVASLQQEKIAFLLTFTSGNCVEYYMPTVSAPHRSFQPLSLVIDRAIRDAIAHECSTWNWGGTWSSQQTLRHFKNRWGGGEVRYCYYTYVIDAKILSANVNELKLAYPYFFVVPFEAAIPVREAVA